MWQIHKTSTRGDSRIHVCDPKGTNDIKQKDSLYIIHNRVAKNYIFIFFMHNFLIKIGFSN